MTEAQEYRLNKLKRERGLSDSDLEELIEEELHRSIKIDDLSKSEASNIITALEND